MSIPPIIQRIGALKHPALHEALERQRTQPQISEVDIARMQQEAIAESRRVEQVNRKRDEEALLAAQRRREAELVAKKQEQEEAMKAALAKRQHDEQEAQRKQVLEQEQAQLRALQLQQQQRLEAAAAGKKSKKRTRGQDEAGGVAKRAHVSGGTVVMESGRGRSRSRSPSIDLPDTPPPRVHDPPMNIDFPRLDVRPDLTSALYKPVTAGGADAGSLDGEARRKRALAAAAIAHLAPCEKAVGFTSAAGCEHKWDDKLVLEGQDLTVAPYVIW